MLIGAVTVAWAKKLLVRWFEVLGFVSYPNLQLTRQGVGVRKFTPTYI